MPEEQLTSLAVPVADRYVEKKGQFDYIPHGVVEQYLIGLLRQVPHQQVVREIYDGDKLTGCVLRLTVRIDGRDTVIEEAGASDNSRSESNGDRLKDSISDAYKRCAMRTGLGLKLWVGEGDYFLDRVLGSRKKEAS